MEQPVFPPVEVSHDFSVPAENVFNAWTDPAIIKKWLFRGETNDIIQVVNSLEPNGAFSIIRKGPDGEWLDHYGSYHEIVRPNLLSFSLEAPDRFPGISSIVIRIIATEDGSHLNLLQTGADPVVFVAAWKKMFTRLEKILSEA